MANEFFQCPKCSEAGLKSTTTVNVTGGTMLGVHEYCDEHGNFHCHNPNTHTGDYRCSRGHVGSGHMSRRCQAPGCDWHEQQRVASARAAYVESLIIRPRATVA